MIKTYAPALFSLIAAAAISASGSARAADAAQPADPTVTVQFKDLDTASPAGARVLLRRIRNAAEAACGYAPDNRDIEARTAFDACYSHAVETSVRTLNLPALTAAASGADGRLILVYR